MKLVQNTDPTEGRDEEAAAWCLQLAEDRLSEDDWRAFDAWRADEDNAAALRDALDAWQLVDSAAELPQLIRARTVALNSFRRANRRRWHPAGLSGWKLPTATAAALLVALVSALFLLRGGPEVYETGIGERRVAVLEDGSRLSLDAATRVEVAFDENQREIQLLAGRAKFDVAKDALRPFSVIADEKVVVATGTSFSVELLQAQARVILFEGTVEILEREDGGLLGDGPSGGEPSDPAAGINLEPGREMIAARGGADVSISPVDLRHAGSWVSGQISFEDEVLGSAVERVNRYSDEKIIVSGNVAGEVRVSGVFDAGDNEAFLEGVTAFNDLQVLRREGQIILLKN
ncbi:hypothetical protein B5C34_15735 [Pacificimonas flava]|uniref:FecR protein domain-containing protein n=2 Tax=Pacificimonas TaxID=1960290 RepID=A0A219B1D8_9SPHN|nr:MULTISPECIES: FecR domain-containing protein [Pacificimonas]MBZ6379583.1 FecR domain-containing protein [Pacificimonas aurantium]OWV31943.1 hypothetical protein B5C34_15735 [Pacificimonas flava]